MICRTLRDDVDGTFWPKSAGAPSVPMAAAVAAMNFLRVIFFVSVCLLRPPTPPTYNAFQMAIRRPFVTYLLVLLLFGFLLRFAHAQPSANPSIVTIDGLGKGTVELSAPWRFHIGDDPRWANPGIDDTPGENGWETILPDRPWGAQSHYAYTG